MYICILFCLYYCVCIMCIWLFAFSDFSFVDFPSVGLLWYCWLGLLTCKSRLPYNLYCVGGDVKHCSIQSNLSVWPCIRFSGNWKTVETYNSVEMWRWKAVTRGRKFEVKRSRSLGEKCKSRFSCISSSKRVRFMSKQDQNIRRQIHFTSENASFFW